MGTYDTFLNKDETIQVQIKAGYCTMGCFKPGNPCQETGIADGIYEEKDSGFVAILSGHVYSVTKNKPKHKILKGLKHYTKWGDPIENGKTVDDYDYVSQAVEESHKIFRPETYGAIGDGVHDDTVAIQSAVDAAINSRFNEVIQESVLDHAAREAHQKVFGSDSIMPVVHLRGIPVQDRICNTADDAYPPKCFFCFGKVSHKQKNWPVHLCEQCIDTPWTAKDLKSIIWAAYEAGKRSVLGSPLEPDEMVEKGRR